MSIEVEWKAGRPIVRKNGRVIAILTEDERIDLYCYLAPNAEVTLAELRAEASGEWRFGEDDGWLNQEAA